MKRVFTQTFGVVGAIIELDGKVLLVKEGRKGSQTGKWNQPAGWIDVGEDPIVAVIREVKEETGLDFKPTGLLGIYSLVRKDLEEEYQALPHAIKLIFRGEVTGGTVMQPTEEIAEVRTFSFAEIEAMTVELRDLDIKMEARDYFNGKQFPLDVLTHTMQR